MVNKYCRLLIFDGYVQECWVYIQTIQYKCSGTNLCNVAGIFIQGHMSEMCNVCILMLLVTLLIALSLYEVHILIIILNLHHHHLCTGILATLLMGATSYVGIHIEMYSK